MLFRSIIYDTKLLHRPRKREIFEAKEKILLRQTGSYPICTIDYEQFFTLDTVHNGLLINADYSLKYLLVLLNSKLLRFLYESQINEGGKVFAQVKIIYIDPLPIQILSKEKQIPFEELADKMMMLKKQSQQINNKFNNYFSGQYKLEKLTKKLENWYELTFTEFIAELNKAIKAKGQPPLTKKDEFDWIELFEENKAKSQNLKSQIETTENEIDKMVYELYGLNKEEIEVIKNS